MTRRSFPNPAPRGEWLPTVARDAVQASPCKPSCCKSPYGHSTVRDGFPAWHKDACHCHDARPPLDQLLAELDEHDNPKENR